MQNRHVLLFTDWFVAKSQSLTAFLVQVTLHLFICIDKVLISHKYKTSC